MGKIIKFPAQSVKSDFKQEEGVDNIVDFVQKDPMDEFRAKVLSEDEYFMLMAAAMESDATAEDAYALIQKHENARIAELLLAKVMEEEIIIVGWTDGEPLFTNPDGSAINIAEFISKEI